MLPLVFIDVDGTLVGAGGEPTDVVWAAARAAVAAGVHLSICTARIAIGPTWAWAQHLDPNGWQIFQSGASLIHTGTGETRSTPLPAAAADWCRTVAADHDWTLELYSDRDYVVDADNHFAVDHAGLLGVPFVRRPLDDLAGDIVRAQFVVPLAVAEDIQSAAADQPCEAHYADSPVMPGAAFVSITAPGVNKIAAIRHLADLSGVDVAEVMMVGDGQNDLGAIQAVGHGVAMGNAHPAVLKSARYRVATVADDGLAEALRLATTLDPRS